VIDPTPRAGWDPPDESAAGPEVGFDGLPGLAPRWGLGDVAIGFFGAELLAAIAYLVVLSVTNFGASGASGTGAAFGQVVGHVATGAAPAYKPPMSLWLTAVLQVPLWAGLLGVPIWAVKTKGNGPVRDLGLRFRWFDVPLGLAIGAVAQFVLVPLIYWPIFKLIGHQDVSAAARQLTDRATDTVGIALLFLIVGIGAPFAEEIFFRGLTQRSLQRRGGAVVAIVVTAVFFALTHFEFLQFPALLAFGLVLGVLAHRTGRLGLSISAHVGFNLLAAAALVWNLGLPG
jgi:membrane protease YdiL (CAAX protease family)